MNEPDQLTGLPGENLVRQGLSDANEGRTTIASCLVTMARPHLMRAGFVFAGLEIEAERVLYRLLQEQGGDAYSRYNALLRELVSFEHALGSRLYRSRLEPRN